MKNIKVILVIAILSLSLVIAVYVSKFGFGLWNEHSKWAELGSFFGGVLGPILAFTSLLYLAFQVEMQWKESQASRLQSEINNRESYISTNLRILIPKLSEVDPILKGPLADLVILICRDESYSINKRNVDELKLGLSARGEAMVIWVNIAGALSYLKAVDENRYLNQVTLVTVQLGHELCVALDRVVLMATDIKFEHHFN